MTLDVTPPPPKSTQATDQPGKTCDERGHYKGFEFLGDLKEMEPIEHIKQIHPRQQKHPQETCHPLGNHVPESH